MNCPCRTEADFLTTLEGLTQTIELFVRVNNICPEEASRALAVIASDPVVEPFLAEAAQWAKAQEAGGVRH